MPIESIAGFGSYTQEALYELRGLFASGAIDSKPIIINKAVIWIDVTGRMHRLNYPAVERFDGSCEYWEYGRRKK